MSSVAVLDEATTTFESRKRDLARALQIPYPIREDDIPVYGIRFQMANMAPSVNIEQAVSDSTLLSRALFLHLAMCSGKEGVIRITGAIRSTAYEFYGEDLMNDEPDTGKHVTIDALKSAIGFTLIQK